MILTVFCALIITKAYVNGHSQILTFFTWGCYYGRKGEERLSRRVKLRDGLLKLSLMTSKVDEPVSLDYSLTFSIQFQNIFVVQQFYIVPKLASHTSDSAQVWVKSYDSGSFQVY